MVYVQLLNEGVRVHRPVPASRVHGNRFVLGGADQRDATDEEWEFPSGSVVEAEPTAPSGGLALVAARRAT